MKELKNPVKNPERSAKKKPPEKFTKRIQKIELQQKVQKNFDNPEKIRETMNLFQN